PTSIQSESVRDIRADTRDGYLPGSGASTSSVTRTPSSQHQGPSRGGTRGNQPEPWKCSGTSANSPESNPDCQSRKELSVMVPLCECSPSSSGQLVRVMNTQSVTPPATRA